jgi:hypothetical protein
VKRIYRSYHQMMKIVDRRGSLLWPRIIEAFFTFFASWHAYRIHRFKHVTFTSIHHPPTHPFHCHQLHPVSNPSHLSRGRRHWQFWDPSSSHVVFFLLFDVQCFYFVHSYLTEFFLPRRSPLSFFSHTTQHSGVSLMRIRIHVLG